MIATDQPTIFDSNVIAAVSSVSDGNMSFGKGDADDVFQSRLAFLNAVGVDPEQTTLVQVAYQDAEHFARYVTVNEEQEGEGIFAPKSDTIADALVTTRPGHALFLPIADCVGVILYDSAQRVLMVSHIGRHSAEIKGASKSVQYLIDNFATEPADVQVWLSPAAGKTAYPLHAMENKGLHEVIVEQLESAGVLLENIEVSTVDTTSDIEYFSHSQFIAGKRENDGRFAIVAMMGMQGEPAL